MEDAQRLLEFEEIVSAQALEDVRGFPFSFVETPGGRLGVSTGDLVGMEPGQVFGHKGDAGEPVTSLGDGGLDMRQVRCLDLDSVVIPSMCFVTAFRDDEMLTLQLPDGDDIFATDFLPPISLGNGPAGLDLRAPSTSSAQGGGPLLASLAENEAVVEVLTSAFFDHAVTRTLVAADGSVVDQVTIDMPLECRGPSSVAWLEGGGFAVTCNTTDKLAIFPE